MWRCGVSARNRVAVVTGGGSGIGRATALALAADGYDVVIAGRREEALRETAEASGGPGTVTPAVTDVARPEDIAALFGLVRDRFGRLDLLFNNAGVSGGRVPVEDVETADWQAAVDINLTGSFLCAQEAFRIMKEQDPQGGRIINNGSISAHAPRPHGIPYTATKHAITGLTKALALEGRPYDIAAGQIDIGNAATPLTERMQGGVLQASGEVMVEPTMDVRDVADFIVHMAALPLSANVPFMTVMATKMPYLGRG
ncbi:MAG: SDR family NAD(P)-dependent oxidoreductase [Streptosporangiales bacterium]|nr:SDR family NAD(P)-dependent oxidoreductase [Streptosporangiales bacterium]